MFKRELDYFKWAHWSDNPPEFDLSGISRESKNVIAYLARPDAPGGAPLDPNSNRQRLHGKITERLLTFADAERTTVVEDPERQTNLELAARQAHKNALEQHRDVITDELPENNLYPKELAILAEDIITQYKKPGQGGGKRKYSKKKKSSVKVNGEKPRTKGKVKVRGTGRGRNKGKGRSKGRRRSKGRPKKVN